MSHVTAVMSHVAAARTHGDALFLTDGLDQSGSRRTENLSWKSHPAIRRVPSKVFDLLRVQGGGRGEEEQCRNTSISQHAVMDAHLYLLSHLQTQSAGVFDLKKTIKK